MDANDFIDAIVYINNFIVLLSYFNNICNSV